MLPPESCLDLSSSPERCLALGGACPAAVKPTRAPGCKPGGGATPPPMPPGSNPAAPSTWPCCPPPIPLELLGGDELGKEMAPLLPEVFEETELVLLRMAPGEGTFWASDRRIAPCFDDDPPAVAAIAAAEAAPFDPNIGSPMVTVFCFSLRLLLFLRRRRLLPPKLPNW